MKERVHEAASIAVPVLIELFVVVGFLAMALVWLAIAAGA